MSQQESAMTRFTARIAAALTALATAFTALAVPSAPAQADPPGWNTRHAHAHGGWRVRHHDDRRWIKRRHIRQGAYDRGYDRGYRHGSARSAGSGLNGGHLIGGILGAVLGSQVGSGKGTAVAVIGGGILGAVIGGAIGDSMDRADHARTQTVLETTPTGRSVEWTNPDSGATYTVTPTKTYDNGAGAPCRDYSTWVFIDGYEEQATGTACRQADGTWRTVSTAEARADTDARARTVDVVYAYPDDAGRR
jgi:surface antigen